MEWADHYHCPSGCEKTVFERKDDGDPTCVRCGARWEMCTPETCFDHLAFEENPDAG